VAVVILLADGARPDTVRDGMNAGELPAFARLRDEGAFTTVTTCFPSVTGPAYAPFLMGRFPAPLGLPGLRWFDRSRTACTFPDYTRSYVGYQMGRIDTDIDADSPTIFELTGSGLGCLNMINRGLPPGRRIGQLSARTALRAGFTHFSGNVAGWLDIDRIIAESVPSQIRRDHPDFTFAAYGGTDKTSHAVGHEAALVREALRIVDGVAARIRSDAERDGRWESMHLWVTSDHGHSSVRTHEDLARFVEGCGFRVMAHPWVVAIDPEVAVMVSGNAMAHVYLDIARRSRPLWPLADGRWAGLVDALLERASVDLVILPMMHGALVRAAGRGHAVVARRGDRYTYRRESGDPLMIGADLVDVDSTTAYEATLETDYPDGIVQIAVVAEAPRSGEIILSAARDWDFRARYEPIPHVSSHGALHREHMLVPLITNRPTSRVPRRTVDLMPSALEALGLSIPDGLDGQSFGPR
jgi:hypothetical protein